MHDTLGASASSDDCPRAPASGVIVTAHKYQQFRNFARAPALDGERRFAEGLRATGLFDDLCALGPYTVLAPVDDAFDAMPWPFASLLGHPDLVEARFDVFEHHVIPGVVDPRDGASIRATLHGSMVAFRDGVILARGGAARVLASRPFDNGVVHVIDRVLLPVDPESYGVADDVSVVTRRG
ncbi:MAG: fasciclin domain-containing protein [Myxococcales bacterium]|jgi:uncharacterized surface protein with fasciclin (FAS1) repeats|nr:fasciclin domain-containing protein [Myxococcales bacterium]